MRINTDDLVKDALGSKATRAAVVDTAEISFHEEFRKACERNACGQYNSNWMGPPAIGPIAELIGKVRKYKRGLLFQTVHPVSGSFDLEGMREGMKIHEQVFRDLLKKMRNKYGFEDLLPLSAGCCRICPRCAYLDDELCRHPDEAVSSLEAYGIDVAALEKSAGIPYHNGKNTVSYVGLILFIRLRRRPRALPVDECVTRIRPIPEPRDCCFGGFRHRRITLRSRSSCAPEGFSARRRRRVIHGGTTGFARGATWKRKTQVSGQPGRRILGSDVNTDI